MVLQAFIDDSGNRPEHGFFVLAGFVSTAEMWANFSDEWQSALVGAPGIEEFKWTEASRLRGAFDQRKGWTEFSRDRRVRRLVRAIKRNVLLRVHSAISHDDFNRYIFSQPARQRSKTTDSPYVFLAGRIISAVTVLAKGHQLEGPCHLYFDRQDGLDKELEGQWSTIKRVADTYWQGQFAGVMIDDPPTFRDSAQFLPLQAADLFAGCVRQSLINGASSTLRSIAKIRGDGMIMDTDKCIEVAVNMIKRQREFHAANPLTLLVPPKKPRS